jgi:hypothetical protein
MSLLSMFHALGDFADFSSFGGWLGGKLSVVSARCDVYKEDSLLSHR